MKDQMLSIQLLKRIAYEGEPVDTETERFLEEISENALKGKTLPELVDYGPKALSIYIREKHYQDTTPEEVEAFYKQVEEITKRPITSREKAEAVVDMIIITQNVQEEMFKDRQFLFETLRDAMSF